MVDFPDLTSNMAHDDIVSRLTSLLENVRSRGVRTANNQSSTGEEGNGGDQTRSSNTTELCQDCFPVREGVLLVEHEDDHVLVVLVVDDRVLLQPRPTRKLKVPWRLKMFLLPHPRMADVPCGKMREELYVRKLVYTAFELSTDMSCMEITEKLSSFFKWRLKGKHFEIVRAVGSKIVSVDISQQSITGRVLKHLCGQGPIYLRCVSPIETDFCWVSDVDEESDSSPVNKNVTDHNAIVIDEASDDDFKPAFSTSTLCTSGNSTDPVNKFYICEQVLYM